MATKLPLTDAEAAADMERLMDELCPNRAEERAALPKGRPLDEILSILKEQEALHGRVEMDEDFARDIEEGMRLLRQDSQVDLWG